MYVCCSYLGIIMPISSCFATFIVVLEECQNRKLSSLPNSDDECAVKHSLAGGSSAVSRNVKWNRNNQSLYRLQAYIR